MRPSQFILFSLLNIGNLDKPQLKLNYEVDPENQNLINSNQGEVLFPTFPPNPEYFVYGGILSLTDLAFNQLDLNGYQEALALQCAVKDVNKVSNDDGLNTTYFYQIFNDQSSPASAMRAAVELLTAGVPVTIGPSASDQAVAVATLYASKNVTILSGTTTVDVLSDNSTYGSFFRTVPPDQAMAQVVSSIMIHFNWTLITPIYTRTAYGLSGQRQFLQQAITKGILLTCGRVLPPGQTSGLQNTIKCLTGSQSTVVMLWMSAYDAANVIVAFYEAGLTDLTFIATDGWGDVQDATTFLRGQVPVSYLEGTLSVLPRSGDQTAYRECIAKLKPDSDILPRFRDYWEISNRCILTEDQSFSICPSAWEDRQAYPNLTCRCVGDENLYRINAIYSANYIYDAVFAVYRALEQYANNCSGIAEAIDEDICSSDGITTAQLQKIVGVITFEGLTGHVEFDGNDPVLIRYEIFQRRSDGFNSLVGVSVLDTTNYTNSTNGTNSTMFSAQAFSGNYTTLIDNNLLHFKNDKTPVSAIVPSEITFSSPIGAVTLIFIILALLISLAFALYFYLNRKQKVIKKTSPFFSQLMLLGIILCILSQIFWDVTQSKFTCILKVWLLAIGFGLIMGNLLAKTYRIFKIFNNAKVTSLVIKDTDLLKFTGVVLIIEVILLCVYCFTTGVPRPVAIQSTSDSLLKIVKCEVPSEFMQTLGIIMLMAVNFLLVLAAVIIAYLTRNVDSAFNESRYIAYTVYIYLLVSIILLPLYYTAGDSASSNSRMFIIRSIAILLSMYFTLGALFLPKIYLVHQSKKAERKAAQTSTEGRDGRRIVDVSHGGQSATEGSTTGGAYSKALKGAGAVSSTVSGGDESTVDQEQMYGPRKTGTATESTDRPSVSGNEFGNLISSLSKKSRQ